MPCILNERNRIASWFFITDATSKRSRGRRSSPTTEMLFSVSILYTLCSPQNRDHSAAEVHGIPRVNVTPCCLCPCGAVSAIAAREVLHERHQCIDAGLGHSVVDAGAHAAHRAMTFETLEPDLARLGEK